LIASRALAVLAAASFVGAFALATLLPPLTTLAQLVARDDPRVITDIHEFLLAHAGAWFWNDIALALLSRPCWMLPVAVGVLCAGGATTLASRASVPRSHRRRS
jgi:hypothetical protein